MEAGSQLIVLVSNGETQADSNELEVLTPKGAEDAAILTEELAPLVGDIVSSELHIWTSTELYAMQTAMLLAKSLKVQAYCSNSLSKPYQSEKSQKFCGLALEDYFAMLDKLGLTKDCVTTNLMHSLELSINVYPEIPESIHARVRNLLEYINKVFKVKHHIDESNFVEDPLKIIFLYSHRYIIDLFAEKYNGVTEGARIKYLRLRLEQTGQDFDLVPVLKNQATVAQDLQNRVSAAQHVPDLLTVDRADLKKQFELAVQSRLVPYLEHIHRQNENINRLNEIISQQQQQLDRQTQRDKELFRLCELAAELGLAVLNKKIQQVVVEEPVAAEPKANEEVVPAVADEIVQQPQVDDPNLQPGEESNFQQSVEESKIPEFAEESISSEPAIENIQIPFTIVDWEIDTEDRAICLVVRNNFKSEGRLFIYCYEDQSYSPTHVDVPSIENLQIPIHLEESVLRERVNSTICIVDENGAIVSNTFVLTYLEEAKVVEEQVKQELHFTITGWERDPEDESICIIVTNNYRKACKFQAYCFEDSSYSSEFNLGADEELAIPIHVDEDTLRARENSTFCIVSDGVIISNQFLLTFIQEGEVPKVDLVQKDQDQNQPEPNQVAYVDIEVNPGEQDNEFVFSLKNTSGFTLEGALYCPELIQWLSVVMTLNPQQSQVVSFIFDDASLEKVGDLLKVQFLQTADYFELGTLDIDLKEE